MNQEKIGKFISNLRKEKKMKQSDLADALGVISKKFKAYSQSTRGYILFSSNSFFFWRNN